MAAGVLLRTSERSSFKKCRWAWSHAYVDCVKPVTSAPPLRFGSLMHKSLERYYRKGTKRGLHPAKTFCKLYDAELKEQQAKFGFRDEDGTWADAGTMGEAMLNHYVDHYGKDDQWVVLATEMPFQVPVPHPVSGKVWFTYVGVLDLVVRDRVNNFVGLVDHKSIKTDPTKVRHLTLDEQAGAYWRFGRQALYDNGLLRMDRELNGIIFNFIRKAAPDNRTRNKDGLYLNKDGSVSQKQPSPYFHREVSWRSPTSGERVYERVLEEFREMQLVRRGKLSAYKAPGMFNCPTCGYRDICELHEEGSDYRQMLKATMLEWNPYAEHEIYDRS